MPQTWSMTCGHGSGTHPQKFGDWKVGSDEGQMEKCRSDGEVWVRLYACIDTAMQPAIQKWGYVESRYRKFKQWSLVKTVFGWLVGGRSVGRMDRSMVGGWIYSKPVGWLVCLFADPSVGSMDGQWLACRLVCSLFDLSVGWSNHPAGVAIQPTTDWPATYTPIHQPLTNQPKTLLLPPISAWISVIGGSTYPRFRPAGWLR